MTIRSPHLRLACVLGVLTLAAAATAGDTATRQWDCSGLLEYFWSDADLGLGHQGNHWSYLVRRWQDAKLLPALDPSVTAVELRAQWAAACEET